MTLASGSTGNCALVRAGAGSETTTLLLDCGIAMRTARDLAQGAGVNLARLDGVLLTHHHSDHCLKVVPLAARARAPLHAHPGSLLRSPTTAETERRRRKIEDRPFDSGEWFTVGAIRCLPVRIDHDAEPTHGFLFEADGQRAGFFTDLGVTDALTSEVLDGLDLLVLEFNHDREMLASGPYPSYLKERVGGDRGHLSNAQAAELLAERAPRGLKRLVLAHLSLKNNRPEHASEAAREGLRRRGISGVEPEVAPARGLLRIATHALT